MLKESQKKYIGVDKSVKRELSIYASDVVDSPSVMTDNEWFAIVAEAVMFCASLVQQLQSAQEELTRLKTAVKDLEERYGSNTVH